MSRLRFLAFALTLVPIFVRAADAPRIAWQTDPKVALDAARADEKMLLVYVRDNCSGACNAESDAMFEKAAADEVYLRSAGAFVPLRIDKGNAGSTSLDKLSRHPGRPLVAIYDASGVMMAFLNKGKLKWEHVGELLLRFRAVRELVAHSVALRASGDDAWANYVLSRALFSAHEIPLAANRADLAAKAFAKRGETEAQERAEVFAGFAWYAVGARDRGMKLVERVARLGTSATAIAEANLRMGAMFELAGDVQVTPGSVVKVAQNKARALTHYRKAYELAAPGSQTLAAARGALSRIDDRPLPPKDGVESVLRLIPPARQTLTGDAEFLAQAGAGVERVDFFLDGKQVASLKRAPFRTTINVGPTPRVRTVNARAFDAAGKAIRDTELTINDRFDAFLVSIVAPVSDVLDGETSLELDVVAPPARKVKNVEVFWNDERKAVLTGAPYRTRITGRANELGYVRAVATLDDGTSAEASKLFNTVAETIEVGAVTLIASVTDKKGTRIGGLRAADFSVQDERQPVVPELRSSESEPVTIGIAIDSSSSMIGKQFYVIRAAAEFLSRGLRAQDEAFVVSFDTTPRLVHPRSRDTASLRAAVLDLVPRGGTSIFDGITFALQQLQSIAGKRALIVLTDGREGASSASARECDRLARELGVPVYLIVPPGGEEKLNAVRGIVEATGGVMHHAQPVDELAALADRIADEVRGQYVLSFTRPAGVKTGDWRAIGVSVRGRDAIVRTIQGYRAN